MEHHALFSIRRRSRPSTRIVSALGIGAVAAAFVGLVLIVTGDPRHLGWKLPAVVFVMLSALVFLKDYVDHDKAGYVVDLLALLVAVTALFATLPLSNTPSEREASEAEAKAPSFVPDIPLVDNPGSTQGQAPLGHGPSGQQNTPSSGRQANGEPQPSDSDVPEGNASYQRDVFSEASREDDDANSTLADAARSFTAPATTPVGLGSWLLSRGPIIQYKYADYLTECGQDAGVAVGNWLSGWWEDAKIAQGEPVRCGTDGWLTFDVTNLIRSGKVRLGRTYCFNFRTRGGAWGQHGAFWAPELRSIGIPAADNSGAMNPGFRVSEIQGTYVVELTSAEHQWRAC